MFPPLHIDDRSLPEVHVSGRFPLNVRGWSTTYCSQMTHALHIHGYRGRMRSDGVEAPLSSGVATLSPQRGQTSYDQSEAGWHWCVHFRAVGGTLAIPAWVDLGPEAAYARERLARITALHDDARRSPAAGVAAGAALLELLAWLALRGEHRIGGGRGRAAVEKVASLLRDQPDRDWRTPELARRVGVSVNWLAARFRARFGMTIDRYRLTQRVELARLLLGSSTLPVAEIGARVGLADAQHFNKVFRAILGVPPSACRGDLAKVPIAQRSDGRRTAVSPYNRAKPEGDTVSERNRAVTKPGGRPAGP